MLKNILSSKKTKLALLFSLVASFMLLSGNAHAAANAIEGIMCNAMNILTGGAGRTFAAFAVIGVGIMFFGGKVTWGLLVGVAIGIGAIFGAPSIVAAITGATAADVCSGIEDVTAITTGGA